MIGNTSAVDFPERSKPSFNLDSGPRFNREPKVEWDGGDVFTRGGTRFAGSNEALSRSVGSYFNQNNATSERQGVKDHYGGGDWLSECVKERKREERGR